MPEIPEFERSAFQQAMRTVLRHPLISDGYPDRDALPRVRRWFPQLAEHLQELFGYGLELTPTTARLIRRLDGPDASRPAQTRTDRIFDRRRYAYLALALAALGRAGAQISLSELAGRVAGDAARIDGLELSAERAADRAAFVDAVGWLEERGAVRLADGSARGWADDPGAGEALYDIDRDVARAVYRPTKVLQHVDSVTELFARSDAVSRDTIRRAAAQRVRRALVHEPVVYYDDLDPSLHGMLRSPGTASDVAAATGLLVERRSDGVALLDPGNSLSDRRFPGPGTVVQVALLLANLIADRVLDPDAPALAQFPSPDGESGALIEALDSALPRAGVLRIDGDGGTPGPRRMREDRSTTNAPGDDDVPVTNAPGDDDRSTTNAPGDDDRPATNAPGDDDVPVTNAPGDDDRPATNSPGDDDGPVGTPARYPLLTDGWLRGAIDELTRQYGSTFAAQWAADPQRLLAEALLLLADLRMVAPTAGGVVALPLLARYRNAAVTVSKRAERAAAGLFAL